MPEQRVCFQGQAFDICAALSGTGQPAFPTITMQQRFLESNFSFGLCLYKSLGINYFSKGPASAGIVSLAKCGQL